VQIVGNYSVAWKCRNTLVNKLRPDMRWNRVQSKRVE